MISTFSKIDSNFYWIRGLEAVMSYGCIVNIKGVGDINCTENSYVNIMNVFNRH